MIYFKCLKEFSLMLFRKDTYSELKNFNGMEFVVAFLFLLIVSIFSPILAFIYSILIYKEVL